MPATTANEAMNRSPAAIMSVEDKARANEIRAKVEEFLAEHFTGAPWSINCPPSSEVAIVNVVRAYAKGWHVQGQPMDTKSALASLNGEPTIIRGVDLLREGGKPPWVISFTPRWEQ